MILDFCPGGELFYHLGREGRFSVLCLPAAWLVQSVDVWLVLSIGVWLVLSIDSGLVLSGGARLVLSVGAGGEDSPLCC